MLPAEKGETAAAPNAADAAAADVVDASCLLSPSRPPASPPLPPLSPTAGGEEFDSCRGIACSRS
jgi:hypothetical protein